ncbi:MAG: hypothetical protein KGI98_16015, partial [Euryarchaeota archaeon]|nr:hypothetical protein [Euryarchaeota archaeon]
MRLVRDLRGSRVARHISLGVLVTLLLVSSGLLALAPRLAEAEASSLPAGHFQGPILAGASPHPDLAKRLRGAIGAAPGWLPSSAPTGSCVPTACVESTLVLQNNTTVSGNLVAGNGAGPAAAAYIPPLGEIFVADSLGGSLSVLNDSLGTLVGNIPVGGVPVALAYDPAHGTVYVAEDPNVTVVVSTITDQIVHRIWWASTVNLYGIAFDPAVHALFVALEQSGTGYVAKVNDTSNQVVTNTPVTSGYTPYGVVYGGGGYVY